MGVGTRALNPRQIKVTELTSFLSSEQTRYLLPRVNSVYLDDLKLEKPDVLANHLKRTLLDHPASRSSCFRSRRHLARYPAPSPSTSFNLDSDDHLRFKPSTVRGTYQVRSRRLFTPCRRPLLNRLEVAEVGTVLAQPCPPRPVLRRRSHLARTFSLAEWLAWQRHPYGQSSFTPTLLHLIFPA